MGEPAGAGAPQYTGEAQTKVGGGPHRFWQSFGRRIAHSRIFGAAHFFATGLAQGAGLQGFATCAQGAGAGATQAVGGAHAHRFL
jgi:hypothetical protein